MSRVTADQTDLEVRLTLDSGESCDGCRVEVKPSQSGDRENVALAAAGLSPTPGGPGIHLFQPRGIREPVVPYHASRRISHLAARVRKGTRSLGVLWNNRTRDGRPVGTVAYIMQIKVTLLPIPGVIGEQAEGRDYRTIGVLRER